MKGPICEYCGSVLDQAELDMQEQEQKLAKKQRQYEEMLRRWQQSVINAELGQSITNRMNYYGYSIWVMVIVGIIFVLLGAVLFAAFLA